LRRNEGGVANLLQGPSELDPGPERLGAIEGHVKGTITGMLFQPTKDEVREFFVSVWEKTQAQTPLSPLESMARDWVLAHPEYHALLSDRDQALAQDWSVTRGQTNPFLHLSMHLALEEQASIDQPQGVRQALARLSQSLDDRHEAMHQAMECLGAMLHEAQASGAPPDGQAYIDCLLRRAGHRGE